MNKLFVPLVILVLIGGAAYYFLMNQRTTSVSDSNPQSSFTEGSDTANSMSEQGNIKTFIVEGSSYSFSPNVIRVSQGDTVRIIYNNKSGNHDLVIDEFSVGTKELSSGQSETIEFVATQKGSFEYYCSVSDHRKMGMVGTLIVE